MFGPFFVFFILEWCEVKIVLYAVNLFQLCIKNKISKKK